MSPDGVLEALTSLRELGLRQAWPLLAFDEVVTRERCHLEEVTQQLLARETARKPSARARFSMDEARLQWREFLESRGQSVVQRRAVRSLCWASDVAADPRFAAMLESRSERPSPSMIRGLLTTYHEQYGRKCDSLERLVRAWLQGYSGTSATLLLWQSRLDQLVGPAATSRLALTITSRAEPTSVVLTELSVSASSAFGRAVVSERLSHEMERAGSNPEPEVVRRICREILREDRGLIEKQAFASLVRTLVRWGVLSGDGAIREQVKDLVLADEDLGDPRRYPERWRNMRLEAEAKAVTAWMSKEDLVLFFDMILKGRPDPQGRRRFWLKFVDRVQASRVVICSQDQYRCRAKLEKLQADGRTFPRMIDPDVSAFIMDFGRVVAVEFSVVNHACFLYDGPAFRESFAKSARDAYPVALLKDKFRAHRQVHREGWEAKLADYLARFGVRA